MSALGDRTYEQMWKQIHENTITIKLERETGNKHSSFFQDQEPFQRNKMHTKYSILPTYLYKVP